MDRHITAPINKETARSLHAGDYVYITGTMYTARDAAHKRMYEILQKGGELPVDWKDQVIYYMGPSPAREGRPIGSAGPTTASRMDKYAPQLLDLGLGAMVGKGKRSQAVIDAIVRNGSVYFAAVGGAGALLSKCITSAEVVAYDDLGTEAIRKLTVENFPAIVVIDSRKFCMIEPYSEIAIHSEKKGYYMNHTLTKEYLLLFNALTDTEETLRQLREDLIAVQRQAEELFLSDTPQDGEIEAETP